MSAPGQYPWGPRLSNVSSTSFYDAAGNQQCSGTEGTDARAYVWDPEGRVSEVWSEAYNNTYARTAVYTYDANGSRIRADQLGPDGQTPQSWREYSFFAGQLLAEKDQDGNRTNYIYANGKKIVRLGADQRLHREATVCGSCGWQWTALTTPVSIHGHIVQPGDRLAVSQYQTPGTAAGVGINFTDGTYAAGLPLTDQDGGPATSDSVSGQWHHRVIDLSSQTGKTVDFTYFITDGWTSAGPWSVDYRDFTFLGTDGSVTKLYSGEDPSGFQLAATAGQANLTSTAATGAPYPGNTPPQSYYLADHLGTTQMEMSQGGWPTWRGDFAPFGQELDNQPTSMRFKFTGKERDAESGLDYFGARHYGSSMGRWMSPDWADKPEAVPYSSLDNPQSLNLYTYVGNNPLSRVDDTGHNWTLGDMRGYMPGEGNNLGQDIYANMQMFGQASLLQFAQQDQAQQQSGSGWTSEKPTSGDYVTVSDYSKSAGGFHHTGLAVDSDDTQGFSTKDPKAPWWQRIFGAPKARMEDDLQMHTSANGEVAPHSYLYQSITSDQAAAIRGAMDARTQDAGRYNLIFRNCAGAVESLLHAGGVSGVPHGEIFIPAILHGILALESR